MTSRKIWAREGAAARSCATSPRATASRRTRWAVCSVSTSNTAYPPSKSTISTPGSPRSQPASPVETSSYRFVECCARRASRSPAARIVPLGDDHEVVAQPLDEIELVRREQHGGAGRRSLLQDAGDGHPPPWGPGPRTARRGSARRGRARARRRSGRAAGCRATGSRRCRPGARRARAARAARWRHPSAAALEIAVQPGEVDDLLEHLHLRVQPALLGHVAEAAAVGAVPSAPPSSVTVPASAASTPSTIRMVVVLPAPLPPTKPVRRPGSDVEAHVRRAPDGCRSSCRGFAVAACAPRYGCRAAGVSPDGGRCARGGVRPGRAGGRAPPRAPGRGRRASAARSRRAS